MTSVPWAIGTSMLILNLPMGTEPTGVTKLKFGVVIRISDLRMEMFAKKDQKMLFNVSIGFEVCRKILTFSSFIRLFYN